MSSMTKAELISTLNSIEFGFIHRRCSVCAGWNVGPNGETDKVHTKECPVPKALAAIESALEDAEFFHLCRWNGWHLCGQTDAGVQQWAIYDYHGSPITDFLPTYQEAIKVALAKEPKL